MTAASGREEDMHGSHWHDAVPFPPLAVGKG